MAKGKFCIFFTIIIGIISSTFSTAYAQLIIDKAKIKLDVTSGETITGVINVHNFSENDVDVNVYFQDFVYLPPFDGRKKFLNLGSTPYSCGNWVSFSPQDFKLAAFQKHPVSYSIKVPENVQGGYYGVLFFEVSPGIVGDEKVALKVIQRIGCLFFLETKNKSKEAKLEDISLVDNEMRGYLSNHSNVILIPKGTFYTLDNEGMAVDRGEIGAMYLPPDEKGIFTINIPPKLSSNNYTSVITFDLEEGDVVTKEIDFSKDKKGNLRITEVRD